jgi:hypothetical protein
MSSLMTLFDVYFKIPELEDQNINSYTLPSKLTGKYWLVTAQMGYGHHRAIHPLKALSHESKILNINTSPAATVKERRLWKEMLGMYEFMSRAGKLPLIGGLISRILDRLLYIPKFYPIQDSSNSTFQVRYLRRSIKNGLCNGTLYQIKLPVLPMLTSFYAAAIAAEMELHKEIYCIICDTDINRVWVSEYPAESRIIYFASGTVSAQRLLSYGVPEKNIVLTGFPLPLELIGDRSLNLLRFNLNRRLVNLDPNGSFYDFYKHSINALLHYDNYRLHNLISQDVSVTITYAVGGAGAQKETGRQIAISLADKIKAGEVKLNLIAGTRTELKDYFVKVRSEMGDNPNIRIIWAKDNETYFDLFNECLKTTDILWTKPSELSLYCALGIPIIMSPAIGPQEKCNQKWLREIGAGFKQQNPELTHQWLFDMINKGRIAEAAWNGFLKARKYGTYNIIDFLENGTFTSSNDPLKR